MQAAAKVLDLLLARTGVISGIAPLAGCSLSAESTEIGATFGGCDFGAVASVRIFVLNAGLTDIHEGLHLPKNVQGDPRKERNGYNLGEDQKDLRHLFKSGKGGDMIRDHLRAAGGRGREELEDLECGIGKDYVGVPGGGLPRELRTTGGRVASRRMSAILCARNCGSLYFSKEPD